MRKRHPRQNAKARSAAVRQPVFRGTSPQPALRGTSPQPAFRGTCASVATPRPAGSHHLPPPHPISRSASRKARSVLRPSKPALNAKREARRGIPRRASLFATPSSSAFVRPLPSLMRFSTEVCVGDASQPVGVSQPRRKCRGMRVGAKCRGTRVGEPPRNALWRFAADDAFATAASLLWLFNADCSAVDRAALAR